MFARYVQIFISNSHYLNTEGRRAGFLLFSNKPLTADLEAIALQLQTSLTQLSLAKMPFSQQVDQFFNHIRGAFHAAKEARVDHAPVESKYQRIQLQAALSKKAIVIDYDYKNPYQSSKFEQELINGLEAVLAALEVDGYSDPEFNELYQRCGSLRDTIRNFSPTEKVIEDRSYFP